MALLFFLATFTALVTADVQFTLPKANDVLPAGRFTIEWQESGSPPSISDLTTFQLFLCAGGDDDANIAQLYTFTNSGMFSDGKQLLGIIPTSVGANGPANAYFLKIIALAATGGTVINYSSRFSLTGMTGQFSPDIFTAVQSVKGTNGPPRKVENGANRGNAQYGVPFELQTGPIAYAPMQKYPGTKITKTKKTPLYPTSAFTLATTFLPPNTLVTQTTTEPITWSFSQKENPATPAGMPNDMQKFLNRWKD